MGRDRMSSKLSPLGSQGRQRPRAVSRTQASSLCFAYHELLHTGDWAPSQLARSGTAQWPTSERCPSCSLGRRTLSPGDLFLGHLTPSPEQAPAWQGLGVYCEGLTITRFGRPKARCFHGEGVLSARLRILVLSVFWGDGMPFQ